MKIEIYSKTTPRCDYCERAKALLARLNLAYEEIDAPANIDTLRQRVANAGSPPPKTVPQVFIDDKYVGGYEELVKHLKV